jgi:hypothetical protein
MNFKRLARLLTLLINLIRAQRQPARGHSVTIQIGDVKGIVDPGLFESQCFKIAQELCACVAVGENG